MSYKFLCPTHGPSFKHYCEVCKHEQAAPRSASEPAAADLPSEAGKRIEHMDMGELIMEVLRLRDRCALLEQHRHQMAERIEADRAALADITKRLRGHPDSRLDGEHGLAAATMREVDRLRAALAEAEALREQARVRDTRLGEALRREREERARAEQAEGACAEAAKLLGWARQEIGNAAASGGFSCDVIDDIDAWLDAQHRASPDTPPASEARAAAAGEEGERDE